MVNDSVSWKVIYKKQKLLTKLIKKNIVLNKLYIKGFKGVSVTQVQITFNLEIINFLLMLSAQNIFLAMTSADITLTSIPT